MPELLTPSCPPDADVATWLREPAVQQAARQLADGGLLGLPTETVYGLAADASQTAAVAQVFGAKGRPADHPLIVHLRPDWADGVTHHTGLHEHYTPASAAAWRLMRAFWPGPLTLILPRQPGVADAAAGGQASVGLRCPAHPAAQAVLHAAAELGVQGVAAPSANRFGRVSPTTAQHVMAEFQALDADALKVLDGGACDVGIESTIVDLTRGEPVLLRPGMLTPEQLAAACGQAVRRPGEQLACDQPAPKASGTLDSHYAPTARVRLMTPAELSTAVPALVARLRAAPQADTTPSVALYMDDALRQSACPDLLPSGVCAHPMPACAATCAHELFAVLRALDERGVQEIWVQAPPADPVWDGVRDRLQRAAA